jgi:PE-PPE domain
MKTSRLWQTTRSPIAFLLVAFLVIAAALGLMFGAQTVTPLSMATASAQTLDVPGTDDHTTVRSTDSQAQLVDYPASSPVTGQYASSVQQGVVNLNAAVDAERQAGQKAVRVEGYSQGAHVVREWAALPGATDGLRVDITTMGDPCTSRTGILVAWEIARTIAGTDCPPPPDGNVHMRVINNPHDPIGNAPQWTLAGLIEGGAGYYYHATYYNDLGNVEIRWYTGADGIEYGTIVDDTPAAIRFLQDHGVAVPPEVQQWWKDMTAQPDPGPGVPGAPQAPADGLVHPAAATVGVATPDVPQPAPPSGNVAAGAEVVKAWVPLEAAPVVDQVATVIQNSPLGDTLNNPPQLPVLPPLPFPVG